MWEGWEKLLVLRDSHVAVLVDPYSSGDFARTTGAVLERRAIG